MEKGIQKGIKEGKREVVCNLIQKLGLNDEKATEIAEVEVSFVKRIRSGIGKNR